MDVGILCKDCGSFIGINAISKDNRVVSILSSAILLDHCIICGGESGFDKVTHEEYHIDFLEEGEDCEYCKSDKN